MGATTFARRRREAAARAAGEASASSAAEIVELVEPPREGRGSSRKAWVAFAAQLGVAHDEGDTREQIIEAVDAHKASLPVVEAEQVDEDAEQPEQGEQPEQSGE